MGRSLPEVAHSPARGSVFQPTFPIETDRMLLRPYGASDEDHLLDLFGRADVGRYLRFGQLDRDGARVRLERRLVMHVFDGDHSGLIVAAVAKDDPDGPLVGEFMLQLLSEQDRQGEIGWVVHPAHQGKGLATEGAARLIRLGFEELGLHRIIAESDARNTASLRVMVRLGMRLEAHHHESELVRGEWTDSLVYAILASEWQP